MNRKNPTLKRIFAVLIATVLVLASVSTAFAAEECEHEWSVTYVSQGNATHAIACTKCGKPQHKPDPCSGFGANCWLCGGSLTAEPEEPECEHEWKGVVNNNDEATHNVVCTDCLEVLDTVEHEYNAQGTCACGAIYVEPECEHEWKGVVNKDEATHTIVCRDCQEELGVESHKYVDGRPCDCGAIYVEDEPECEHKNTKYVSTEAGKHDMQCADCGYMYGFNFTCKGADADYDGVCDKCGYQYKEPECEHEWKGVVNKDEATHTIVCRDCLEVLGVESHKYVDGRPCACGAIYVEDECEHEWKGVSYKDEASHKIVCRDCLEELGVESHKYVDNRPCACGAIYVEDEHECDYAAGVTSNEDGTHNVNCSCGKFVKVNCLDNDGDGKCDSCGYQKYIPECKHEWKGVVNKDEGSHYIVCRDCLKTLGVESHKYVNNMPCACGKIYIDHKCDYAAGVTSNEDGTHNVNCSCGKAVTITCLDNNGDGKCDSCGYSKYETACKHEWKGVIDKDEASHYIVCRDCLKTLSVESHMYLNNMPCACGRIYIEDEPAHKCDYAAGVVSNDDGTHNVKCSCGKFVTVTCLDNDGDRFCDSCGYEKYAAPTEEPTEEPTVEPTDKPTDEPTVEPTDKPTEEPTEEPTDKPTDEPTVEPTDKPTDEPTVEPTDKPTDEPTEEPADKPEDGNKGDSDDEVDVPKTGDSRADMMRMMLIACAILVSAGFVSALAYLKPGKSYR